MNIKDELIKYAKWYDRATMPEDAQTDEADLVQNVESYLQTEGKNIVLSDVSGQVCPLCHGKGEYHIGGSFGGNVQIVRCNCGQTLR